jgi:hypothetical protein
MLVATFVCGMWTTFTEAARAQNVMPQPELSIYYDNLTAVRYNPLGLVDFFDASVRLRLFESESDVSARNFVGLGIAGGISPAWARIGAVAYVQPLTILQLYARYVFVGYFGSFDLFASFPSADSEFSDTAIDMRGQDPATSSYATLGGELTTGARVRFKVGPIAARAHVRGIYTSMDIQRGDRVFYDQIYDMLMPNDGWILINDFDALFVSDFGLVAGVRWTYSHGFFTDGHFDGGTPPAALPNNDVHRLGPLVAYIFHDEPFSRFDKPTILLLAQWHLVHRWRTGADVSTGVPYIGLGFKFEGDLLGD